MFSFTGDSSFALLKLRGGLGPVAIMLVTCEKKCLVQACDYKLDTQTVEVRNIRARPTSVWAAPIPLTILLALLLDAIAKFRACKACPLAACI